MTIQQAMRQLIVEGLIYTRKGQGTFVPKLPPAFAVGAARQRLFWRHQNLGASREVTSRVIRFELRFPSEKEQTRC
jgi:GntR family transcriptional regulator